MRPAIVATRCEYVLGTTNTQQGSRNIGHACYPRGILVRTDENEIIVHDGVANQAESIRDKLVLRGRMVHEQHVGIAARGQPDGLPRPDGNDANADACFGREERQQVSEQAGVFRGCR